MKQGTANLAEDYCFIHKALRPVGTTRRKIAAVPPSNSRPAAGGARRFGILAKFSVIPLCQCLSEETLKAVGPFYLGPRL